MPSYQPVRAVQRAFNVLGVLNAGGCMSLTRIAEAARLSKATTLRLLDTLEEQGMVGRDVRTRDYRVGHGVQRISWGFVEDHLLALAGERLDRITKQHLWPCALGVPTGHAITARYSTHRFSPLNWWNPEIRAHLPMLEYAMGLAYLAFCAPDVQQAHLDLIRDADERASRPSIDPEAVRDKLAGVRAAGFAFRPDTVRNRTCSLAVPLIDEGRPLGSLVITYFGRTLVRTEAERRFIPLLLDAAAAAGGTAVPTKRTNVDVVLPD